MACSRVIFTSFYLYHESAVGVLRKKLQIHRVEFWGPHSRSGPGGREIRACGSPQISIPFRSMLSFCCRTTSFRISVTAYAVYSQLPSIFTATLHIHSYPPYLEAVSSIRNLMPRSAVVTVTFLSWMCI